MESVMEHHCMSRNQKCIPLERKCTSGQCQGRNTFDWTRQMKANDWMIVDTGIFVAFSI
jgi:hypothetical protein